MFIVYILMIISRFLDQFGQGPSLWGPSWPGAEFVRGRVVQLPTRQFKADLCNEDFDWLIYRIMVYDIINYGTYHN